jgi:Dyp-type peroxidase family
MAVELDLADIQGNILTAYGQEGFPKGRFMLFHIDRGDLARRFVTELLPTITTALRGPRVPLPEVAVNIAFTFYGLLALGIPIRTLRGMPDEFVDGMLKRAPMLGDDFYSDWKDSWDEVWTKSGPGYEENKNTVHILVTLNAKMNPDGSAVAALETKTSEIIELAGKNGVRLLPGHNQPEQTAQHYQRTSQERPYQDLSLLLEPGVGGNWIPTPKEHFGFTDGIGNPVFDGQQTSPEGQGAVDGKGKWRPLATGEFLLGYPDEAQEIAGAAMPLDFSRNGTFMAYRKLHQFVRKFREFIQEKAQDYAKVSGIGNLDDAREILMAKMAGRWSDGVPISVAPSVAEWHKFNIDHPMSDLKARYAALADFKFRYPPHDDNKPDVRDDPDGTRCPLTAHMRRVNTRDMMAPTGTEGSILNNRRRILRRGLPYGARDEDEHGVVMLIVCANLFRQFEFVQQQWINYGLDSGAGSDTCPIVGNHSDGTPGGKNGPKAKFVIPPDPASGHPPFIADGIPQFVETRGGEYFFVPSMTALRMIGMGVVDPT